MICAVVRVLVGLMPSIVLLAFLGWGLFSAVSWAVKRGNGVVYLHWVAVLCVVSTRTFSAVFIRSNCSLSVSRFTRPASNPRHSMHCAKVHVPLPLSCNVKIWLAVNSIPSAIRFCITIRWPFSRVLTFGVRMLRLPFLSASVACMVLPTFSSPSMLTM